jgi:hypothetical protein
MARAPVDKDDRAMFLKLARRLEQDCGMARAGAYYRQLLEGGYIDPNPVPKKWLLANRKVRQQPLEKTTNPHYPLLPDVSYWRLEVRFHQRGTVAGKARL